MIYNSLKASLVLTLIIIMGCKSKTESMQSAVEEPVSLDLVAFLDTIWRTEQLPIRLRDSLGRVHGFESEEFKRQDAIYHQNHLINEKKVTEMLDQNGWPSKDIIGEQGNITICNVLQHSGIEVRQKYIQLMKDAVDKNELEPWLLARAEDRLATDRGELQVYGGQIKYYPETQSFNVWPILDPANVDKRRAEIGLEPMEEFLNSRREGIQWNLEEQIKRSEEFEKEKLQ